jgi:uncharacterized protein
MGHTPKHLGALAWSPLAQPEYLPRQAFLNKRRVIAEDLSHSGTEQRYFCFGRVGSGVMTVRFTWRRG